MASFEAAINGLGIRCPLMLTQNDGTVVSASMAAQIPIRTFSSGATNSMRGAAFLAASHPDLDKKGPVIVADIGGTTCDVGMLLKSGFPRQSAAYTTVGGVRMNFTMPHVESVGLGGGSIVRELANGAVTVGPDSVGSEIKHDALVYGGSTITATDVTVATAIEGSPALWNEIGTRKLAKDKLSAHLCNRAAARIKTILESVIDRIKTLPDPIPVLLVGGGAIIAPSDLKGASKVIMPQFSGVANAVGAAMGKVSGKVDLIETIHAGYTETQAQAKAQERAIADAVKNGALASTVIVTEVDSLPLQYTANKVRIMVKATGEIDYARLKVMTEDAPQEELYFKTGGEVKKRLHHKQPVEESVDITTYKPTVTSNREWLISEVDLECISIGAYILGTGGGGSPYEMKLQIREILRQGGTIKVMDIEDIVSGNKDAKVSMCGFAGSPTVLNEQLCRHEIRQAYDILHKNFLHKAPEGVVSIEIGGSNGLQSLYMASSAQLDVPCVDGDFMGRAYPTLWQVTPYVLETGLDGQQPVADLFTPLAISDGNGNTAVVVTSESLLNTEKLVRANLSELGSAVGFFTTAMCARKVEAWVIKNSISLAWRIGAAVLRARQSNELDNVGRFIIESVGGPGVAREIYRGKIVGIERRLEKGHAYGEVIIESTSSTGSSFAERLTIPFKNENIMAKLGSQVLASVPDLISVIDEKTGEAIGTPEYKYGLHVLVLVITGSHHWTSSPRALEIGGPAAFGFPEVEYVPVGRYEPPVSVIDQYAPK